MHLAVGATLLFLSLAIDFHQHGGVDASTKGIIYDRLVVASHQFSTTKASYVSVKGIRWPTDCRDSIPPLDGSSVSPERLPHGGGHADT